jgi:hypothetical protein
MTELESGTPISECIELISKALNLTDESSLDYEVEANWEYLSFKTSSYRLDMMTLNNIFRNTNMIFIEIEYIKGLTEICFGRPLD